jgi:hypothetical protein
MRNLRELSFFRGHTESEYPALVFPIVVGDPALFASGCDCAQLSMD